MNGHDVGVDEVVTVFALRALVEVQEAPVFVGLGCLDPHEVAPVELPVPGQLVVGVDHGLVAGDGERRVPVLLRHAEHLVDGLLGQDGAGGVVYDDDVPLLQLVPEVEHAVAGGVMRRLPSRDHGGYLGEAVLLDQLSGAVDPVRDAHDDDRIHGSVPLEVGDGVYQDGLPLDLQELLGHGGAHALSDTSRQDDRRRPHVHRSLSISRRASANVFMYSFPQTDRRR